MFLTFRITYLTRVHRGRGLGGREFPPHPVRLHAALVNAWALGGKNPLEHRALEWLEKLPPPWVWASTQDSWTSRKAYVPPNEVSLPSSRRKQVLEHYTLPLASPVLLYSYPLEADPEPAILQALEAVTSRVTYLGTSRNLVVAEVALGLENIPEGLSCWKPGEGKYLFRTAPIGFLSLTEQRFAAGYRKLPYRIQTYYLASSQPQRPGFHASPWDFAGIRALDPPLPPEWAALFTHALRLTLLSRLPREAPSVLTGHDSDGSPLRAPHLALVPLPYVGTRYSDGRILGVAFLLPKGTGSREKALLQRALVSLDRVPIATETEETEWKVDLLPPDARWTLQESRWRQRAHRFVSVFPMVFDRYPKKDPAQSLAQSAVLAGFPNPISGWAGPFSTVRGAVQSRRMRLPLGISGYVAHAGLEFSEPVEGPLILGRGRYLGLGLFVPVND
ncbi:type I-U CRISPR-associated protein Csb2 [Thermus tengchongensis]|uniref:type I-G CRISPR-associated protein Csb2 n=1 Tax=Thermus tengchongensis TaxID=1214928 RepID=UPI000A015076|nr:type I-U CRISPR-associated protein Csb2 [Thermus tengchongensis]